jgi:hypothetical protein
MLDTILPARLTQSFDDSWCPEHRQDSTVKNVALKLVALFEVVSGVIGLSLAVPSLIGVFDAPLPKLWYGFLPLASLVAGIFLWRRLNWAFVLSALVQLCQIPVIRSDGSSLDFAAALKLPISAVWCAGDNCRVKLVVGADFLALGMLLILLWSKSDLSKAPTAADGVIEHFVGPERR